MNALRNAAAVAAMTLASLISASPARVGGYGSAPPKPCGHDEVVCVTRAVRVPCTTTVTLYDHCGRPYRAGRTTYTTVAVTVKERVFVAGDRSGGGPGGP